ncbi:hypothetical protein GX50_04149 [[Emmonsia] crescens]|uniref:Uncharacterized protein n=1 Tax=[Emmonsia] crescens TaxID=73230 RepID=A0A2B7ZHH5_9EURO|nr:hypothetical protein GX50_04149 [Emmonsia crescens]
MRCVIDSHIDLLINGSNTRKGEDEGTATKVQFLDQYIIFSGVPSDVLEHKIPESSIIEKTFSYHRQTKTLVLKMVLRLHERASRLFDKLIIDALRPMGLDKELGLDGKARVHSSQRDKEPACSYCPRTLPTGRSSRWPSMVVEVAYAGAQGRRDRVRLMSTRAGGWKIQMEMDIKKEHYGLKVGDIATVKPEQAPTEGLRVTELIQQIKIVRLPSTSTMGTAPLRLPFEKLMLRRPSAPLEGDILIPDEGLKELGENVWEVQEQ